MQPDLDKSVNANAGLPHARANARPPKRQDLLLLFTIVLASWRYLALLGEHDRVA